MPRLSSNIVFAVGLAVLLGLGSSHPVGAEEKRAAGFIQLADAKSDAADQVFLEAVKLYRAGDFAGAVEQFELGLSIDSTNPVAHFYLAKTYEAMKRHAKAFVHYRKAAELGPGTKEGIIAAAIIPKLKRKVDAARAVEDAKARAQTAVADKKTCEDSKPKPNEIVRACTAVISRISAPPNADLEKWALALWRRGAAYRGIDKCEAAIEDLSKARNLMLKVTKGKIYHRSSDFLTLEDVTILLATSLATSPHRKCRSGKEALRLAAEFPIFHDEISERHYRARALIYAEIGQFDRAIKEQEAAIRLRKQFFKEVSWSAADMKVVLGEMQRILDVLRKHKPVRY